MDISTSLLEEARKQISFNTNEVTTLLYGSAANAKAIVDYHKKCTAIPELYTNADFYNWDRKKQFLSKDRSFVEFTKMIDNKVEDINLYAAPMLYSATTNYYGVFYGMVLPALKILGSDEQVEKWYAKMKNLEIASCYAQTELGHGSDVQSLKTTATYDQQSDEFIIHTPSIDATKFWPGDLGILANWALVFAQLIVNGQSHGVQAFMVPIRDFQNHKPLPGIEVGDIGPKMGYQTKDNGYLRLTNVRIPRSYMLCRYTIVNPNGEVKRQGNSKVSYSSMMLMRKLIITVYPRTAASAVIIAVRYSITRQQFTNDKKQENSVIEYQSQQDKLFPLLANLYSVIFTGMIVSDLVDQNFQQVQQGNFSLMNVCHALLCATKSNFTHFVVHCIEWCRLSCGGHGFAHYSGMVGLYQENSPNVTLEGENQIMQLQLARYILKIVKNSQKNQDKIPIQFELFKRYQDIMNQKYESIEDSQLINLLESSVIYSSYNTASKMMTLISEGQKPVQVWNQKIGVDLLAMANFYTEYFKYVCFLNTIKKTQDSNVIKVLTELANLYAIHFILNNPSILVENEVINQVVIQQLREKYEQKLQFIKKEAIGLVDSFQYIDEVLRSAIGCYDGKPYERIYNWATKENSFNQADLFGSIQLLKQIRPRF